MKLDIFLWEQNALIYKTGTNMPSCTYLKFNKMNRKWIIYHMLKYTLHVWYSGHTTLMSLHAFQLHSYSTVKDYYFSLLCAAYSMLDTYFAMENLSRGKLYELKWGHLNIKLFEKAHIGRNIIFLSICKFIIAKHSLHYGMSSMCSFFSNVVPIWVYEFKAENTIEKKSSEE